MAKTGDNLALRYESWKALDFHAHGVVDCASHHQGFGFTKWHRPHPPTQPTWGQLIRLLLSYKGQPDGSEAIREYQRDPWGSSAGETCVIELSGLASPNMRTRQDRTTFLGGRIARIRKAALAYPPEFIVMYGIGNQEEWEQIAGCRLRSKEISRMGKTLVIWTHHPSAKIQGNGNDHWTAHGRLLRRCKEREMAENIQ